MDWRTLNFDWNHARAVLVTAEEGSFSAAARALGISQPTVGRQVAALESELGLTLVERVGRGVQLTSAGAELVDHLRAMAEAASRVSLGAAGQSASLEGKVAITASEAISAHLLPPVLKALRADHPGITIDLVVSNQRADLRRREADIAVRNFRPEDPELVGRLLGKSDGRLYASPAYVESIGGIESLADLARAEIFGFDHSPMTLEGLKALGAPVTAANLPIVTSNHLVQWGLCKAGVGICIMMEEVGRREPGVVEVLPEMQPIPVPLWLVCHRELRTSRRLRVVYDALSDHLKATVGAVPPRTPPG